MELVHVGESLEQGFRGSVLGESRAPDLVSSRLLTRCIKPNDKQQQGRFTSELVMVQARYLGLLENVRVRRAGYAFRQAYKPFLERYRLLSRSTWPRWNGDDR